MSSKAESMEKVKRHPIKNFILMPELQWPYIIRILALVNLSGVLMATTICVLFYMRYEPVSSSAAEGLDMVNQNLMGVMIEQSLLDALIPAFIIADVVSLVIGLVLSLYFSRKISVPIYRVSRWAEVIESGDLAYRLKFRPGDDLESLEEACNRVSDKYAKLIEDFRREIEEARLPASPSLARLKSALEGIKT
jgi:methyl-accepting chemotaxis protein